MTGGNAEHTDEFDEGTTQEIRLAVVMTGGASLAVWMGGVAREINLLTAARAHQDDPAVAGARDWSVTDTAVATRWAALLAALDLEVSVDVLAGASAGGINVALLGYANVQDTDLGPLRDLWIQLGSLRELMRRPDAHSFPSLLRGDEVMLPALRSALQSLDPRPGTGTPVSNHGPRAHSARTIRPTSVFITTTILRGETSRWPDDLGGLVRDRDHRGLFVFGEDDLADPEGAARLALAARASAAFPGAFEPAYIPVRNSPDSAHPDMADHVNAAGDFHGSDGGILVNRPLGPALQEIFDRPTRGRQVRRVLTYVVPAPNPPADGADGANAADAADAADEPADRSPPSAVDTLLGALSAALNQSISTDLRRISAHNEAVRGLRTSRRRLARLAPAGGPRLADQDVYTTYRAQIADRAADLVIDTFDRIVIDSLTAPTPPDAVPADAARRLADARGRAELRLAAVNAATAEFPDRLPGARDLGELWRLGRPAVDAVKGTLISMINEGYVLTTDPDERRALSAIARGVHGAVVAPREQAGAQLLPLPSTPANRGAFTVVRHTLRDLAGASSDAVVAEAARRWLRGAGDAQTSRTDLTLAWSTLSSLAESLRGLLDRIVARSGNSDGNGNGDAPGDRPRTAVADGRLVSAALLAPPPPRGRRTGLSLAARRQRAAQGLRDFIRYLPADRERAAIALLDLHLVTRTLTGTDVIDQPVELVQVSSDIRCDLDPARSDAHHKLTGLALGSFGAFAKSSWRANDWMWGRLDGAAWLVRILLDPRRLVWLRDLAVERAGGDPAAGESWLAGFVAVLSTIASTPVTEPVLAELAWLDDPAAPVPPVLPETAAWVAAGIQREIAAGELVSVATAVRADIRETGAAVGRNREFLDAVPTKAAGSAGAAGAGAAADGAATDGAAGSAEPAVDRVDPADTDRVLRLCHVADERLTDRPNSRILVSLVAQTLAVLTAWLASLHALPWPFRPAAFVVRTITRLLYAAVDDAVRHRHRVTTGLGVIMLVGGLAVAVTQGGVVGGLGVLATAAGLALVGLTSWRTVVGSRRRS